MADTAVQSNNKAVVYRGKAEHEMPKPPNMDRSTSSSEKQNPAGLNNNAAIITRPAKHKRKAAKSAMRRGMISEKAAKKHFGDGY